MDQPTTPMPATEAAVTQVIPEASAPGGSAPVGTQPGSSDGGRKRRSTLRIVALVVVLLMLGGCTGAFFWQRAAARDAEMRAEEAELRAQEWEQRYVDAVGDVGAAGADVETETDEPGDGATGGSADTDEPDPAAEDGRFIGYITEAGYQGADIRLVIDYVQMLGGQEAADAAAAAGEESPPPNDYFILNENPRLREFQVNAVAVTMWTWDGHVSEAFVMEVNDWLDLVWETADTYHQSVPYWVTVEDGVVVAIEEQYLP